MRACHFELALDQEGRTIVIKSKEKLLEKLDDYCIGVLENAAGFCITRTHYEVSFEHILIKMLEDGKGDIPRILEHFEVDSSKVRDKLLKRIEQWQTGNSGQPTFSPILMQLLESAFLLGTIEFGLQKIRSGIIWQAFLDDPALQPAELIEDLRKIKRDDLSEYYFTIVENSCETSVAESPQPTPGDVPGVKEDGALGQYTNNITGEAREGKLDPVFGRDAEIRQMFDILSRRRKNNPILVGEAGVGKTAIVEGLALRIVENDVPDSLKGVEIRGLDLGLLQAGASQKGEFENRLKNVIRETKESATPIILFIDEAHTLIGAGGAAGTGDAANLLKPALARGELRTVAATTWSEYKEYFEKDPALVRRFQPVKVEEPDEETAAIMLRGIKGKYELHHNVHITDQAVKAAVTFSKRYIAGRQLPDKAVDLLDTASARVKMSLSAKPSQLEFLERSVANLEIRINSVERDIKSGVDESKDELGALIEKKGKLGKEIVVLTERWSKEKKLVAKIHGVREELLAVKGNTEKSKQLTSKNKKLRQELDDLHDENALIHPDVSGEITARVVSDWTGIPIGNMVRDEAESLLKLEDNLRETVVGQDQAVAEIANVIRVSKEALANPEAPMGVFLLVGPSGVGKTQLALSVADLLFGGERFLTTLNMSEYREQHTVSQLKGSPPGYVGYGKGGILTEAVRQKPYSVVLLDETEKAHPEVLNLFYQVFDKGFMRDGEGREIDFRNTILMMTSNLASDTIIDLCSQEKKPAADELEQAIQPELLTFFQRALLNRMKVLPFYPLDRETMKKIVILKMAKVAKRLKSNKNIEFTYQQDVLTEIANRCTEIETGARNIDFIIDRKILPDIARRLLMQLMEEKHVKKLELSLNKNREFTYDFS